MSKFQRYTPKDFYVWYYPRIVGTAEQKHGREMRTI